jgi:hypothetical protein
VKRYRVLAFDFDARAISLALQPGEQWSPQARDSHLAAQQQIRQGLIEEFGLHQPDEKLRNFMDIGPLPLSIQAFHNKFFAQARNAFVVAAYYPALTATCALGERILNHLMRLLRGDFKRTPQYKEVYRKDSFDNWDDAIDTLASWGVLLDEATVAFKTLRDLRNQAIHFDPATDTNDRPLALGAIRVMTKIISTQFPVIGNCPWFIPKTPGMSFIAKAAESEPFVRRVYLPRCALLGPAHALRFSGNIVTPIDMRYSDIEITDDQYRELVLRDQGLADAVHAKQKAAPLTEDEHGRRIF